MADVCPVCYTEAEEDQKVLPCCRNFVCPPCMIRWESMSNHCPLCKAQLMPPDDVLAGSLTDLFGHLDGANECLQMISSLPTQSISRDQRTMNMRSLLNEVFDRAMTMGLFESVPSISTYSIEMTGLGGIGEGLHPNVLAFLLAVASNESADFSFDFELQSSDSEEGEDENRGRNGGNQNPSTPPPPPPPEDGLLSNLLVHISGANDCLQKLSSVSSYMVEGDQRAARIRPLFNQAFERAMKTGIFGSMPSVSSYSIGETVSRDIFTMMLAMSAAHESSGASSEFDDEEDDDDEGVVYPDEWYGHHERSEDQSEDSDDEDENYDF